MKIFSKSVRPIALAVSVVFLGGCASFSQDGGFSKVSTLTKERIGKEVQRPNPNSPEGAVDTTIRPILAKQLTVDDAVTIALLNNKNLQAAYADLGIAEADLVQAGRLPNPGFSFGRLKRGDEIEIERRLMVPVVSLLTMPIATRIERRRFEQAQLRTAGDVLQIADDTRRAYFSAIAAQETVKYMQQVKLSAEATVDLALKMVEVGNWSPLDLAMEQAVYADVQTDASPPTHMP